MFLLLQIIGLNWQVGWLFDWLDQLQLPQLPTAFFIFDTHRIFSWILRLVFRAASIFIRLYIVCSSLPFVCTLSLFSLCFFFKLGWDANSIESNRPQIVVPADRPTNRSLASLPIHSYRSHASKEARRRTIIFVRLPKARTHDQFVRFKKKQCDWHERRGRGGGKCRPKNLKTLNTTLFHFIIHPHCTQANKCPITTHTTHSESPLSSDNHVIDSSLDLAIC